MFAHLPMNPETALADGLSRTVDWYFSNAQLRQAIQT
jgi:dTDP-D-glucose 4,6-dehydratase